ncbi:conserved hypothetical protein [Sporisorium reilianum SRZ2]|uniref:Uncharacterized protein n=1 Tax=Sporisorium reilianum (strain SRZ2) TaxID=999809 RepID=E6ZLN0_SPORE|nr:conserved hypothetical protein [Sporisorium reilianum SRZ2]
MSRFGGRFVPNLEQEVRRQAVEPIGKWRQEWVTPTGTSADGSASSSSVGVKILKWVRVPDEIITFPEEQDVLAEDRVADDAAIVEAPVQSIHNAPAVGTPLGGGSLSSVGGGLGTIAPKEPPTPVPAAQALTTNATDITPASAIPPHVTSTFSEPTTTDTTADNTPTDSVANTPGPSAAPEPQPASQGAEASVADTPQIQPQVESQLHDQPVLGQHTDSATLAVLAAGAEAEQQPAAKEDTLVAADPTAAVPATTFEDDTAPAAPSAADVEMNDA